MAAVTESRATSRAIIFACQAIDNPADSWRAFGTLFIGRLVLFL